MTFLETPSGWERFVEPWWLSQFDEIKRVFRGGRLTPNFLAHRIYEHGDWHNLFAKFGMVHHYYRAWSLDYEAVRQMNLPLGDPTWGGLGDWVGMEPESPPEDLPFSPTVIYKSAALGRNLEANGLDLSTVGSMVHWGGGFGLHSLMMRWWGASHTEFLIDLPVMAAVQYEFLRHNLDEPVHLVDTEIQDGVINVVPLSRVNLVPDHCDVFLALHSLNESTVEAQKFVAGKDWFGAEALVLEWTDDHPHFQSSSHWMHLSSTLIEQGRVISRSEVRGREVEEMPAERLAAEYEGRFNLPVLYLGGENWVNVADYSGEAPEQLAGFLRGRVPVVVIEVGHVPRRSQVAWVGELAEASGYYAYDHGNVLLLVLRPLAGNLGLTIPQ